MCLYKKEDIMSKRFQKVLTNAFHVSFLETIEHDPCERSYSLTIEAQSNDPSLFGESMFVKLCHSQEECKHYEILLDENGNGSILVEGLSANTVNVVLVDECGNQIVNGDGVALSYMIEGERQQEDYARLFSEDGADHYTIKIVSERLELAELCIVKKISLKGELQSPHEDDCFMVCLEGQGMTRTITLDASNSFEMCVTDLCMGRYEVREIDAMEDTIYRFNGCELQDTTFSLLPGKNVLELINQADYDTSLTISKYIRNNLGELCRPQRLDCYEIRVITDRQDMMVRLDEENDFCLTLHGLIPGYYTVVEESDDRNISYIVNDSCEKGYANLEVSECGENQVMIITTMEESCIPTQTSQLRICKFIRNKDGSLTRPKKEENFQVTIAGCGLCQTLNLNESNNFCVDIASLCNGYYTIEETSSHDYVSSYIVNDDMERTSACIQVHEEATYCVTIINSRRNSGSLRVCKYIRNHYGDLVKPQRNECFDVTLSSYFCKEFFTLSYENDWCVCFDDLKLGSYEIREQRQNDDYRIDYQIDCGKNCGNARFIMDGCDHEVKIINHVDKKSCGTLKICKYEETHCKELVKPQRDECFHVQVQGPCFQECYTLKASNNWCILLDGLEAGEYHIQEEEAQQYDACYLVKGCRMEDAYITMGECNEEVCILNHRKRSGILEIEASIQDCDGHMELPYDGMDLEVLVEGKENCYHVYLNADNHWCVLLDQLPDDTYRIIQKDNFGFAIHYQVNGEESDFARITMNHEDHHITIINEMVDCAGMVKVTKYIEDEYGNQMMPCAEEEYRFELKGNDFCHTYTLCAQNDFCVYFDDLMQGCYEIKELDEACETRYLLNKQPYETACFTLGKEDIYVDIINKETTSGGVVVEKRIRKGNHIVKPQETDCFKILLSGRNTYEIFELNADNDFCVCFNHLYNQHYEIKELSQNAKTYLVDGCEQENGYFLYEGEGKQITIINEEEQTGALRLEKLVEDDCGNYIRPQRFESFEVMIESDCFKRKVTLDIRNNFCVCLYDIPSGHYEIKELGACGRVSYIIHDIPCESAIVDLVDEDVNVTIINHKCQTGTLHFQGFIEQDGVVVAADPLDEFVLVVTAEHFSKSIVLHAGNDFCAQLCDLLPDSYTITECGKEDISFVIEDQHFDDMVCVELNGEFVEINVIKKRTCEQDITISKWMVDETGKRSKPDNDEHFIITLLYKGRKQMFELNAQNDFTKVLHHQNPGHYEVMEESGNATYVINDAKPMESGSFSLKEEHVCVDILNEALHYGTMTLQLLEQGKEESLITPKQDTIYEVELRGKDIKETLHFTKENQWSMQKKLPYGTYSLKVRGEEDVCYFIDHVKQEEGLVNLQHKQMTVQIVIQCPCHKGSILLQKYIRSNDCDCIRRPNNEEEYEIEIKGKSYYRIIYLHEGNSYQQLLEDLEAGSYEIKEVKGEDVSYIVNGGIEEKQAVVQVNGDKNHVKIINEAGQNHQGSIEICKLMKDEEGCYCYPKSEEVFWMLLKGEQETNRVLLNEANHFYASIRNLKDGWYEVVEEHGQADVRYVVNNGAPMKKGIVHVMNNANTVNVINPMPQDKGSIRINKWMREQGSLVKPTHGEYRIHISRPGYQNLILLNEANEYTMMLTNLEAGSYVIKEMDHEGVTYVVDGQSERDLAIVDVAHTSHTVDVINTETTKGGSISMVKYRRVNQQLMRPSPEDSYEFYLSAPGYQKLFYLDQGNDWKMEVSDLANGTYVLNERNAKDEVSYIIDSQSEVQRAIIEVQGDAHQITIINTPSSTSVGGMHIQKFVRVNQQLTRPDRNESYELYISKPGFQELYTLNDANDFTLHLNHLEDGFYVLDERNTTNQVSYMINGGSETSQGIVEVKGNQNSVLMINTANHPEKGSIQIEKFVRENGRLRKPDSGQQYQLYVSKPGFQELYTLDISNDFSVSITNLEDGFYVLDERNATDDVSYIVNGGTETSNGIVEVKGNANQVVMVNTSSTTARGSIQIEKYVRENGRLRKPDPQKSYELHVSKPGFNELYTLDSTNNFTISLSNLEDGFYVLDERNASDQVSYIINGGTETNNGIVDVRKNANQVVMINAPTLKQGSIKVEKMVRENGQLRKPDPQQSYQLHVSKPGFNELYTLNSANDFTVSLSQLEDGFYVLDERNETGQVSYIINGGTETSYGIVEVKGNTNEVVMINASQEQRASIFFSKLIKNADGSTSVPADGDVYMLEVYNQDFLQRITLNGQNHFQYLLANLKEGVYHLRELDSSPYRVTYRINGSEETSEGVVYVQGAQKNAVEVLNERLSNLNTVEVFKYMLDKDGNYLPPTAPNTYRFEVTAPNFSRVYDLVPENNWHVVITDLSAGTYQIKEMTQDAERVRYLVNSAQLKEEAFFTALPDVTNIIGIINLMDDVENGTMTLTKKMRDAMGQIITPVNGESFVMRIIGEQYDRLISLDVDNQYTYTIENLAYGTYQIEEQDTNYNVSYQINQGTQQPEGIIEIQNGDPNEVLIINSGTDMFYRAADETVKIVIE